MHVTQVAWYVGWVEALDFYLHLSSVKVYLFLIEPIKMSIPVCELVKLAVIENDLWNAHKQTEAGNSRAIQLFPAVVSGKAHKINVS